VDKGTDVRAKPLSPRFADDGKAAFAVSPVRQKARSEILAKLRGGVYRLIPVGCPSCGNKQGKLLSEKDATGLPVYTSLCLSCGLVYASLRFDDRSLAEFYHCENLRLDRGVSSAEDLLFRLEVEKAALLIGFLEQHRILEEQPGSLVVEIGCGPGGILAAFKERGFEIAGFDLDPAVVAYGSLEKGLELYQGSVDRARAVLAEKRKTPSLIIYEQALEHFPDPKDELQEIRTLMGPNTLLFVGVPGLRNIGTHYGYDFLHYLQPGHLVHFERLTLCRMLAEQGFEAVAATEDIRAVFKIAADPVREAAYSDDVAQAMLAFLFAAERKWRSLTFRRFAGRIARGIMRRIKIPLMFVSNLRVISRRKGI
jgi:SAM-dependent methyltransferase